MSNIIKTIIDKRGEVVMSPKNSLYECYDPFEGTYRIPLVIIKPIRYGRKKGNQIGVSLSYKYISIPKDKLNEIDEFKDKKKDEIIKELLKDWIYYYSIAENRQHGFKISEQTSFIKKDEKLFKDLDEFKEFFNIPTEHEMQIKSAYS